MSINNGQNGSVTHSVRYSALHRWHNAKQYWVVFFKKTLHLNKVLHWEFFQDNVLFFQHPLQWQEDFYSQRLTAYLPTCRSGGGGPKSTRLNKPKGTWQGGLPILEVGQCWGVPSDILHREQACEHTGRQTRVKTLPSRKLRMQAVKRFETCWTESPSVEKLKQDKEGRCKESWRIPTSSLLMKTKGIRFLALVRVACCSRTQYLRYFPWGSLHYWSQCIRTSRAPLEVN